jgi:hypothetical protein
MELVGKVHHYEGLTACPDAELGEQVHIGKPSLESEKLGFIPTVMDQPFPDRLQAKPKHRGSGTVKLVVGLLPQGISQTQSEQGVLQRRLALTLI